MHTHTHVHTHGLAGPKGHMDDGWKDGVREMDKMGGCVLWVG